MTRSAVLYNHPDSPKNRGQQTKPSSAAGDEPAQSQTPRWYSDPAGTAATMYDRTVVAGESIAWRSAISGKIALGLVTQAESDAQEVRVLTAAREAGIDPGFTDKVIAASIGHVPFSPEETEARQRDSLRQLQEEFGEARVELAKEADAFLNKHPVLNKVLEKSGGKFDPRVALPLFSHVKRLRDQKRLQQYLANKAKGS